MKLSISRSELRGISGIYCIICHGNRHMYIGSATDLNRRLNNHNNMLRCDKHPAKYMQASYKKYGDDSFEFTVLETNLSLDLLEQREQYYLDLYKSYDADIGFNTCKLAGRPPTPSPEHIKNMIARTAKKFEIISPEGILYKAVGVNEFARQHGLHAAALHRVVNGDDKQAMGWRLPNTTLPKPRQIMSPEGQVYNIPHKGLKAFADVRGLSSCLLGQVLRGQIPYHRGWTLPKTPC